MVDVIRKDLRLELDPLNVTPKLGATVARFPVFRIAGIESKFVDDLHRFNLESRDCASYFVGYGWRSSVAIGSITTSDQAVQVAFHHHTIWQFIHAPLRTVTEFDRSFNVHTNPAEAEIC
jgi:hypothetical protein